MTLKKALNRILYYCTIIIYVMTIVYPIFLMTVTSLKPTREIFKNPFGFPKGIYLDNYIHLIVKANFDVYFLNSILIVLISLLFIVMVSAPASFVFARYSSRWNTFFYIYFLAGLVIPIRLGTISLLKMFVGMGLNDNIVSLIIINIAVGIPLGVFILTDFIKMIPKDLFDAARLDGCSEPSVFMRVVLPLLMPAISALAIVIFIPIWNDFWFPLILIKSDSMKTIPLATALLFGQYRTNFGLVFAALSMASLPIVAFYLVFSKFFVKGLLHGAIKG
ncbi:MAG: carbohydrate ABC transporter permease [Deltaproteobacteria bacterium]|nr:carbohydrate ABC transporter permease [Deltaproteobacteria bacterium]